MDLKTYAVLEKLKSNSALLDHMVKHETISIDQASDFFKPLLEKEENKEIKLLVDDYPKYLATHVKLHIEQLANNELQVDGEINDQLLSTISLLSGDDNQKIVENAIKSNLTSFSDQDVKLDNLEMSDSGQDAVSNQLPSLAMTAVKESEKHENAKDQHDEKHENAKDQHDEKQENAKDQHDEKHENAKDQHDGKQENAKDQHDEKQENAKDQHDEKQENAKDQHDGKQENAKDQHDGKQENAKDQHETQADGQNQVDIDGAIASAQGANAEPTESEKDTQTDSAKNKSDSSVNTKTDAETKENKSDNTTEGQNDPEKQAKKTESDVSESNADSKTPQLAYDRKVANTLREAMQFLLSEIKKYKLDEDLPNINTKALMI